MFCVTRRRDDYATGILCEDHPFGASCSLVKWSLAYCSQAWNTECQQRLLGNHTFVLTYLCGLADFGTNDLPFAGFVFADSRKESLTLCERTRTCQRGSYVDVLQRYLE